MKYLLITLSLLLCISPEAFAQKKKKKKGAAKTENVKLDLKLEQSPVFSKSFTGFALYDPEQDSMLYEYNSDKYFTPASNTKIFTYFTCLRMLKDSVPALIYEKQGDFLVFWGTGDPSFLHPDLVQNPQVFDFLKNSREELFFCPNNFKDERYGSGWMWSDFPYNYQAEKSPFPVYGNVAHFRRDSLTKEIEVLPSFLKNNLYPDPLLDDGDYMGRSEFENRFTYNGLVEKGRIFEYHVPFRYSPEFLAAILEDTLKRPVHVLNAAISPGTDAAILYSLPADSLYKSMLQESDNFIAEQLLLLCSGYESEHLNTSKAIEYAMSNFFKDIPDRPQWVDGSGLSRYNLFTPRSIVWLLDKIYRMIPVERLLGTFPAGGVSGTIKNNYRNGALPYVFAKTGTLRNNHCLSGYLFTKTGKLLIFSFMHNNYMNGAAPIRKEMERVLLEVRERY